MSLLETIGPICRSFFLFSRSELPVEIQIMHEAAHNDRIGHTIRSEHSP
jgi:hypothetical protein